MGRIRTTLVKRTALELVKQHRNKFTNKFQDNKKKVEELMDIPSKKLRNIIAGYVTKLVKKE
ncbi:MAG: 30S ribosomal protein S17e [archaeon]